MAGKYDAQIARGMALLDEKLGASWIDQIDIDSLRLEDPCKCVLGQLYAPDGTLIQQVDFNAIGANPQLFNAYESGLVHLGLMEDELVDADVDHGFCRDFGNDTWVGLTRAWKRAIRARLAGQS